MEQRGHLVDERAGAARARTVHALLDALVEVDDLGVLAAELDGHVGLGDKRLHSALASDDLLHELQAQPLREQKAARAGDGAGHGRVGQHRIGAGKEVAGASAHIGVVALVLGVDDSVLIVQHGELHRGGAHVDAQVELAVGVLGIPDSPLRGLDLLLFRHLVLLFSGRGERLGIELQVHELHAVLGHVDIDGHAIEIARTSEGDDGHHASHGGG